jgi:hypothetical protein
MDSLWAEVFSTFGSLKNFSLDYHVIAGSIFTRWLQYCKEAAAAAEWTIIAKDREVSSFGLFHSIAAPRISKGLNSH